MNRNDILLDLNLLEVDDTLKDLLALIMDNVSPINNDKTFWVSQKELDDFPHLTNLRINTSK